MIKEGKVVSAPTTPVGNLRLLPEGEFPWAWFARQEGDELHIGGEGRPEDCPQGNYVFEQYDTAEEERAATALMLHKEHKGISDEKMLEHPNGHFRGRGRNRRWQAEIQRRGLAA